jgi:hypothetical protein
MDRMTEATAAALVERIDTLADNLAVAEEQVEQTHTLANRLKIAGAVIVLLIAGLGYAILETRQNAKQSCLNANESRAAQRAHWSFFFEVTIAGNPDAPPAVLEFYDAYVTWLTEDLFADRDCDNPDKKYEIGDPPSYEEALKAALEDEAREK